MFELGWNSRRRAVGGIAPTPAPPPFLRAHVPAVWGLSPALLDEPLKRVLPAGCSFAVHSVGAEAASAAPAEFLLSLFVDPAALDPLADAVLREREAGRTASLVIALQARQLASLGRWLQRRIERSRIVGLRLIVARDAEDALRQLPDRLSHGIEDNIIRMPVSTEVERPAFRSFHAFSPALQALIGRIRAFATNGISRAYLLGGPGSGKTSLAYFYYLVRARGRFVSVNLAAENTGDKGAVKSLLCGHVSGAFPGAGARQGAFSHAGSGVCFLDESHGVHGPVMEVLMEALDNGQFLPFGASAKQPLECALLFASNRSWAQLQNAVNIDEFTRLGAAVLEVPELQRREEDLIAVAATTLARLGAACTTWIPPEGFDESAWRLLRDCRWHGNVRALVRVIEAAFVDSAGTAAGALIAASAVQSGIQRWEPDTHHSHGLYAAA